MEPFRHHVFVCTQAKPECVPCCPTNGSWEILDALESELLSHSLDDEARFPLADASGCVMTVP